MEDFEKIILNISSPNKAQRSHSESYLTNLLTHSPDSLSSLLLTLMQSQNDSLANQSLIIYRTLFTSNPNPPVTLSNPSLKPQFLSLIHPSRSLSYLKKLSNILITLSVTQKFEAELLNSICTIWLNSPHQSLQLFGLYLLETCKESKHFVEILEDNAKVLLQVLWKPLQSPEDEVKIAACRAICAVLATIQQTPQHFQAFSLVLQIVQSVKSSEISIGLSAILGLITVYPFLARNRLDELVRFLGKVVKDYETEAKKQAAMILSEIVKNSEKNGFSVFAMQEMLTAAFLLMSEVEFVVDLQAWTAGEVVEESDSFEVGKELLCGLSEILEDKIYPHYTLMLEAHLNSNYWLHQHTGILSLGLVSEGFEEQFTSNLEYFSNVLYKFAVHEHPRLRHAALASLGLFCTYLAPNIQKLYFEGLMRSVLFNFSVKNAAKVKINALRAMINLCDELEDFEDLQKFEKYLPGLVQNYEEIFISSETSHIVLTELIKSLSAIALTVDFSAYFGKFLPKLESIFFIQNLDNGIKAVALKCIGCIVKSVSIDEASRILTTMLELKKTVDKNAAIYNNLMEVIIKCIIKLKSVPDYFTSLLQEVLDNAKREVEFMLIDTSLTPTTDFEGIDLKIGDWDQKIILDTIAMENKTAACELIRTIIEGFGSLFAPWVNSTFDILLPLTTLTFDTAIKQKAFEAIFSILESVSKPSSESLALQIFPKIFEAIFSYPDMENMNFLLKNLQKIASVLGGFTVLGLSGAVCCSQVLAEVVVGIFNIIGCSPAGVTEDVDDLTVKVLLRTLNLLGTLIKSFRSQFQSYFLTSFNGLFALIISKNDEVVLGGLQLLCEFIEATESVPVSVEAVTRIIKLVYHESVEIRQEAVLALGLVSWYMDSALFYPYVESASAACKFVLSFPNAFDDNIESTECTLTTLAKLGLKYQQALLPLWFSHLPFKSNTSFSSCSKSLFLSNYPSIHTLQGAPEAYSRLTS